MADNPQDVGENKVQLGLPGAELSAHNQEIVNGVEKRFSRSAEIIKIICKAFKEDPRATDDFKNLFV